MVSERIVTFVPWVSLHTMEEPVEAEERTLRIRFFTVPVARAACAFRLGPKGVSSRESNSRTERTMLVRLREKLVNIKIPPVICIP